VVNVVVAFPVRNEEKNITSVLDSLFNQDLTPKQVFIANDGSTDKTKDLASKYQFVTLVDIPFRESSIVGTKEMANIWNSSIKPIFEFNQKVKVDYILFLGGDLILSKSYISSLVNKFKVHKNLKMASGIMTGEYSIKYSGFMLPGGGRMVEYDYWNQIGGLFPFKDGWEAYPVYKANYDGYETKVFSDIFYHSVRPTGGRTNYFSYGKAMKALGYSYIFAFGRIMKQPFMQGRNIKASINMLFGFIFGKTEFYDHELRNFVKKTQIDRIISLLKIF